MDTQTKQVSTLTFTVASSLRAWADAYIVARKSEGAVRGTVRNYGKILPGFVTFCEASGANSPLDLTPDILRRWLVSLERMKPGSRRAYYIIAKAFVNWWAREEEPLNWRNPFAKVAAPKVPQDILPAAGIADIEAMVAACNQGHHAERDKAILLTLLDTGLRATELCALDVADVDPFGGQLTVKMGKGGKSRAVFLGQRARRVMRAYLKTRGEKPGALFLSNENRRLSYSGLRQITKRRAADAGVKAPPLHSFRRAFCLAMLRSGTDLLTLSRLMGHSGLNLLAKYAAQNTDDLRAAHAAGSPVDKAGL